MLVADMPVAAQETWVYDEYLTRLGELGADEADYAAVSLVGPRNPNGQDRRQAAPVA
jgi:hypothetical protein